MEMQKEWIKTDEQLPEKSALVLGWYRHGTPGFGIACLGGDGQWTSPEHGGAAPEYWMHLPEPPGERPLAADPGFCKEVVDGRLMLDIDEEPEAVARFMQHFIDGSSAVVNGSTYFVTDMNNEMISGQMVSVFYLIPAD